jgi:dTMP kinase
VTTAPRVPAVPEPGRSEPGASEGAQVPGVQPPAAATAPADHPGLFVSFEGGDGVGKSTQLVLLGEWLRAEGHEVVTTREPGGTPLGRQLRAAVLHGDHMGARAEALLYAADRAHHVDTVVRPALERGAVVLTDRYLDSSVAYQGDGRLLGAREVEQLSLWATEGLLPDLTVLLDLDPAVGLARLTGAPDRLESAGADFHDRTRRAFLARATTGRWLVVDAARGVEEVQQHVRARVAELLAHRRAADAGPGATGATRPAP